jgi:hypothetical protein
MRSFVRSFMKVIASSAVAVALTQCTNRDSVSPGMRAVRHADAVTYPLVTYTGAVAALPVGDSEIVHANIQMAADSATRPCTNCYFASTNESVLRVAATTGWGTGTIGHIYGLAAGTASFYSDTTGNTNPAGTFQVVVSNYPVVTYKGAVDTMAVGDSEFVSAFIQMAADSAVRPCTNCYFASTNESVVAVAATTGWGTGTVGHIYAAAIGTATLYSDTVGNSLAIGSMPTVVVAAQNFTPNLPPGMTAVINTGAISVNPATGGQNGGASGTTFSTAGAIPWNLTNDAPTTMSSVGEWSGNLQRPATGTGLQIDYLPSLNGGNSPVVFGGGWSNSGTGYLYVSMRILLSSNWTFSQALGIKIGEPRTTGMFENHVLNLNGNSPSGSDPEQPSVGANAWISFITQFTNNPPTDTGYVYPTAPQGYLGPDSDYLSTTANIGGSGKGSFHTFEWYIQPESPAGSHNGNLTMWVDGTMALTTVGLANGVGGRPPNGVQFFETGETPGWNFLQIDPTFGGDAASDHPQANQYTIYDRIYVAVK